MGNFSNKLDHETSAPPTKPIAIAVVERSSESNTTFDEVLIGLRPEGVPLAGYWEFPGGKVKTNESFESAAVRECEEETELQVEIIGEYPETKFEYEHAHVYLRFFRCRLVATPETQEPRSPFRWVAKSNLDSYPFPEANAALVQLLMSGGDVRN